MKLFRINSLPTFLRAVMAWPALIIALYMGSAWIGSSIPANGNWRPAANGVDIFVETNGVHVSIILPISAAGEDLSDLIRLEDLSKRDLYGTHAMIGWGHGPVYRNTRSWSDLKLSDAASAVFGSDDSLLHVYHLINPQPLAHRKKFRVSIAEYRKIVAQIKATFRLDDKRQSTSYPAYGPNNIFYKAKGRYSALTTCNEWTGKILRSAGIKVGQWTPMPGGVMKWFE